MVTYAVMEYGSVLYETDDELLAHAWAATATLKARAELGGD